MQGRLSINEYVSSELEITLIICINYISIEFKNMDN